MDGVSLKAISFVSRLRRIRFSTKLFISYLILCTIPVLLVINIFYFQAKNSIEEASVNFNTLFASQLNNTIHMYMTGVDNTSRALFTDYDIIYYLGQEDSFPTLTKINRNLQVNLKLAQYYTQMPFLQGIMIISGSGKIYSHGIIPETMTTEFLNHQTWYHDILASNGKLIVTPSHSQTYSPTGTPANMFSAGRLLTDPEGREAGVVLFHMTPYTLVSSDEYLSEISEHYNSRIILATSDNEVIFDSQKRGLLDNEADLNFDDSKYFVNTSQSHSIGMKITVAVSKSVLYENIRLYRNLAFLIAGIMLLLIAMSSILLSYQTMKPIVRLINNMRHVEAGYYQPIRETESSEEFHQLTNTYNLMIMKIKHLIEDVYLAKIKQNETKFLALQNQINPHWLYNTLESIRMKAQLGGSPEVATMIKTLGRLFYMAFSTKQTPNLIKDELDYVYSYLELQNIRYEGRFHLSVDLPEEVLQTPVIKLTLQPIIENSIIHGFLEHDLNYRIRIQSQMEGDHLYIQISDDGAGMSEARLQRIQTLLSTTGTQEQSNQSIGLLNIQERLQLHYGNQCGLSIASTPEEGTQVTIKIPLKEAHHVQSNSG
jgi:two-component system sensor histidine kinase YesM